MMEHQPSWRKPVGALMMIVMIGCWAWLVGAIMERVTLPFGVAMLCYAVAGIIWIFPARPIVVWMETGRFRANDPDR